MIVATVVATNMDVVMDTAEAMEGTEIGTKYSIDYKPPLSGGFFMPCRFIA
jgi:hypothetical protein